MYIRRTLSCCICHVFYSVFSVYVHLLYIFLSLFFVDGFYCAVLLDIILICCCTPDNDVDSPSPDMGRHNVSFLILIPWDPLKSYFIEFHHSCSHCLLILLHCLLSSFEFSCTLPHYQLRIRLN